MPNIGVDNDKNYNNTTEKFYTDLTYLAENNLLLPFYGRDDILTEVIDVLSRKIKSNVILLGDPGVGKTAIVEGLAVRIINGQVPLSLIGKKIFSLNIVELLSGSRYRGDFEERLNGVLKKIIQTGSGILFIDEIHTIVNNNGNFNLDIANILKPILSRSNFKCIGATTTNEYYKSFVSSDTAFARRFKNIIVPEMSENETYLLLRKVKYAFEKTHSVHFSDKILRTCISLAGKFIINKKFPDKAIDLIDNSGALVAKRCIPKFISNIFDKILELRLRKAEYIQNYDYSKAIKIRDEIKILLNNVDNIISKAPETTYKIVTNSALVSIISRMSEIREEIVLRFLRQIDYVDGPKIGMLSNKNSNYDVNIQRCIDIILKNFYFYNLSNSPVGRFFYVKSKFNDPKKFCEMLSSALFKTRANYLYIDILNFTTNGNSSPLFDALNSLIDIISESVLKHCNLVIFIDNFVKASCSVLKFIYKIFTTGSFQDSNYRTIKCKNVIFVLCMECFDSFNNRIGFYRSDNITEEDGIVFNFGNFNDIIFKIIQCCNKILPSDNKTNIIKSEIISEINKLMKIIKDYGFDINLSDNFFESLFLYCDKKNIIRNDLLNDFINSNIVGKLFVFIKEKRRTYGDKKSYILNLDGDNIQIIEKNKCRL